MSQTPLSKFRLNRTYVREQMLKNFKMGTMAAIFDIRKRIILF